MVTKERRLLIYVIIVFLIIFLVWLFLLPKTIRYSEKQDSLIESFKNVFPKVNSILENFKKQLKRQSFSVTSTKEFLTNEQIKELKEKILEQIEK
ncbi:hypothetical protein J7K86_01755 [bacterium]|nr:hypothetical protein [bacterium]